MLLFILGRQPEIGIAELNAVSGGRAKLIAPEIAVIDNGLGWSNADDFSKQAARRQFARLGSVVKIAEVFAEIQDLSRQNLIKIAREKFANVDGKISLGISLYGFDHRFRKGKSAARTSATKIGLELKNILREKNSVRLIPSPENSLNSATVFHNNLAGDNLKKSEIIFARDDQSGKILAARTIFVQDIDAYTFRDRGRPKRDARVGMLPPKLAQTMINLAVGKNETFSETPFRAALAGEDNFIDSDSNFPTNLSQNSLSRSSSLSERKTRVLELPEKNSGKLDRENLSSESIKVGERPILLDPFCGTGVILQEAALMNLNVYGSDLEPRMIDYSEQNLAWLKQKLRIDFDQKLETADATDHVWQKPLDFVATETYLGRPYSTDPDDENLRENIANCDLILTKFLKNLYQQITPETGICVAVPCWFVRGRTIHLKLIRNLTEIGFEQIFYSDDKRSLIYHRENQIVGRELLVLRKKTK